MKNLLNKIENVLLLLLPVVVFFSYYPVIRLGENDSMHFELSLPIIWLAIFGVISLFRMPEIAKKNSITKSIIICAFPLYATLAIIWSENKVRGVLTAGILWLIVFSVVNIVAMKLKKEYLKRMLKIYMISAFVAAVFCVLQCVLDVLGAPRDITMLCPGCTYLTFGFPHSNGLAIEPQFMGNLLIAPALISLGMFYNEITAAKNKRAVCGYGILSLFFAAVLYICFSRGALYAYGIAGIIFGILLIIRDRTVRALWLLLPVLCGCLLGLLMQGVLSEISPTSENFAQGIQRSIHQITLGKIDIREKEEAGDNQASFSGYVEESTDVRVNITETAIKTWGNSNIWFGVGLGGAGTSMSKYLDGGNKKEIIQNEYVNMLTELGIFGACILAIVVIYIIKQSNHQNSVVFFSIIVAYLITFTFFSGFPNVLHIYLLTPVIYKIGQKRLLC